MRKVRLGIVGVGDAFRKLHRPALSQLPEVVIEMVADAQEERARKTGQELRCRHTMDYRELMRDDGIDAVLVCVPPCFHEPVAVEAARAGKHILCEKPLAPTVAGCNVIVEAAAQAGVKLMVAENWLFDPLGVMMRQRVADQSLGKLRRVRFFMSWWCDDARLLQSAVPGRNGPLLEDGIHMIALSRALLGRPRSVTAAVRTVVCQRQTPTGTVSSQVEDEATATLEFEEGTAVCEVTWLTQPGGLHTEFHFARASITAFSPGWDRLRTEAVMTDENGKTRDLDLPKLWVRTPSSEMSYLNEDAAFLRYVLDDVPSPYSGEEGREDVRILELIYDAAEQEKKLNVS
ncbi:MAG: Gfo/Idh/MocA family oxidoreductase [Planctomycetota bacterium]